MRIGSVVAPGPEVKLAITRSSIESVKARRKPARIAGAMIGRVIVKKHLPGRRAEIEGGFLQRSVEGHQPRLHDHGDEAHGEGGMRYRDGPDAAIEIDGHRRAEAMTAR